MGVGAGFGVSDKNTSGDTRTYLLGDSVDGTWSPALDLAYRLSGQANQSNAQSNLLFGGTGYGGSFESAEQRAAREQGWNHNAKPYGGWGGYGSTSPVQYWDPSNTRPDWTNGIPNYGRPPASGGAQPSAPPPGGPGGVINDPADPAPPPRNGGTTPTWPQPGQPGGVPLPGQPGGPAVPPKSAPYTGEQPTFGMTLDGARQQSSGGLTTTPKPEDLESYLLTKDGRKIPRSELKTPEGMKKYGIDPVKGIDGAVIPAKVIKRITDPALYRASGGTKGFYYGANVGTTDYLREQKGSMLQQWKQGGFSDAQIAAKSRSYDQYVDVQDFLNKKGDSYGVSQNDVMRALESGATTDDLKKYFGGLMDTYGPRAFTYAHQALAGINPNQDWTPDTLKKLRDGTLLREAQSADIQGGDLGPGTENSPTVSSDDYWKNYWNGVVGSAGGGTPYPTAAQPKTSTPPSGSRATFDTSSGFTENVAPAQNTYAAMAATANATPGATAGFDPITGRPLSQKAPARAYESSAMTMAAPGATAKQDGAAYNPEEDPEDPEGDPLKPLPPGTSYPPTGAGGADPYPWYPSLPPSTSYPPAGVGAGDPIPWMPQVPANAPWPTTGSAGGPTGGGAGNPIPTGSGTPPKDNSLPPDPKRPFKPSDDTDGTDDPGSGAGQINYARWGQPDPWEQGHAFEQGSNSGITPDAWSTSAPWRPTEPTGGIYGAFSEMAGGQLTPYENRIGEAWQGRAVDPGGWADQNYYNALAEYNKGPGIGLKESYDAYNSMINSGGYSDAEKGAISGSAVRGVTAGYQRGMEDMRRQAARTGNANSAYAAMASMAPGYGAQLGETNRQNQIKFADEKSRRNEAGAAGMTNVAALGNTKAQFGLNSQQNFANELARRQETAIRGMGDYAAYGRGLQQQGLSGMSDLYKQQNANTQNYYNMIANLLSNQVGSRVRGSGSGMGANVSAGAGGQ